MTRYQLGKLVALAGILSSRKRVQKIVHLLKAAGCPIEADFRLHFYGPYSDDVASLLNELVQLNLLVEAELPAVGAGRQFKYRLSDSGGPSLATYEATPEGKIAAGELESHQSLIKRLLATDLGILELASTIVFIRQTGKDWDTAITDTCAFKHVQPNASSLLAGAKLARSIVA